MDHRTKKLMKILTALHQRDDIYTYSMSKEKKEKEDCVDTTIHGLEEYPKKQNKVRLIIQAC